MLYTASLYLSIDLESRDILGNVSLRDSSLNNAEKPLVNIEFSCLLDNNLDNLIGFFDSNIVSIESLNDMSSKISMDYILNRDIVDSSNLNTLMILLSNLRPNNVYELSQS